MNAYIAASWRVPCTSESLAQRAFVDRTRLFRDTPAREIADGDKDLDAHEIGVCESPVAREHGGAVAMPLRGRRADPVARFAR